MKLSILLPLIGFAAALPDARAGRAGRPDHAGIFRELIVRAGARLAERQGPPAAPVTKIGNLQDAGTGGTATNDQIMNCFNSPNGASCLSHEIYFPPPKDTPLCEADTCCIWSYIKDDLVPLFKEADGTCSDIARNAVRFGFHDAGAWDVAQTHGGADGSLLLSPTETDRLENSGLSKGKAALLPIYIKYKSYGISAADFVQFAHNVAVVTCPLGPRSLTFVGRPEWTPAAGENPIGLLPDARSPADVNLDLFVNKTIGNVDLVALLGAHTTAKQFFFDTTKAGMPLDSTPGVWDVAFYSEVAAGEPKCGVFRLPSDTTIGNETARGFQAFSAGFPSDIGSGQVLWNGLYSRAYLRLSLLGVANIQGLTDCSKVLPLDTPVYDKPPSATVTCPASSGLPSSTSSAGVSTSSASSAVASSAVASSVVASSAVASSAVASSAVSSVGSSSKVSASSRYPSGPSSSLAASTGKSSVTTEAPPYPTSSATGPVVYESVSSSASSPGGYETVSASASAPGGYEKGTSSASVPVGYESVTASPSSEMPAVSTSYSKTVITTALTYSDSTCMATKTCSTLTLTSVTPVYKTYEDTTRTVTHVSTFAVSSGTSITSTWEVPVTELIYGHSSSAKTTMSSASKSPCETSKATKASY